MNKLCESKAMLNNQIGFRKGFRPADNVFTLKTMIDQTISQNKKLYTCFFNFRKAYDTIWRVGLYYKLLEKDASKSFTSLLKNNYSNILLGIKLPLDMTSTFSSKVGLKQGCNLSPILFNLFINDFIDELMMPIEGTPYLQGTPVNCLIYADDLVLTSETKTVSKTYLINHINTHRGSFKSPPPPPQKKSDIFEI